MVCMRSFCVRMNGLDSSHTILMKLNVDNVVDLLKLKKKKKYDHDNIPVIIHQDLNKIKGGGCFVTN